MNLLIQNKGLSKLNSYLIILNFFDKNLQIMQQVKSIYSK